MNELEELNIEIKNISDTLHSIENDTYKYLVDENTGIRICHKCLNVHSIPYGDINPFGSYCFCDCSNKEFSKSDWDNKIKNYHHTYYSGYLDGLKKINIYMSSNKKKKTVFIETDNVFCGHNSNSFTLCGHEEMFHRELIGDTFYIFSVEANGCDKCFEEKYNEAMKKINELNKDEYE